MDEKGVKFPVSNETKGDLIMFTIKWLILCVLMSAGFAVHAYAADYNCSEDCSEQCSPGDIVCFVGCEVYKADYCDGQTLCGPEQAIPNEHIVGICDAACQQGAPVTAGAQTLDVCMNYSGPVTSLMGIMTRDFSTTQWLWADDCSFSDNFQVAMDGSQYLNCSNVQFSEAFKQGWVFWLVAPVSLDQLDWEFGDYELLFYQIPKCPYGEVEIRDQCVGCSDSCVSLFPGDVAAIVQCEDWQYALCQ